MFDALAGARGWIHGVWSAAGAARETETELKRERTAVARVNRILRDS